MVINRAANPDTRGPLPTHCGWGQSHSPEQFDGPRRSPTTGFLRRIANHLLQCMSDNKTSQELPKGRGDFQVLASPSSEITDHDEDGASKISRRRIHARAGTYPTSLSTASERSKPTTTANRSNSQQLQVRPMPPTTFQTRGWCQFGTHPVGHHCYDGVFD